MGRRAALCCASAVAVVAMSAGVGRAQSPPPAAAPAESAPAVAGERTGPNAAPLALPSFATPSQPLPGPPPAAPPAPPPTAEPPSPSGAVLFSSLRVTQDMATLRARPTRRWRAVPHVEGDLKLTWRQGERLDGAWVKRQFADNGLIDAEVAADRVVALILMINRAYADNGDVNTGLLMPTEGWPGRGETLTLRLVAGRVVPLRPGDPAIRVTWVGGHSRGLTAGYIRARLAAASRTPLDAIALERDFRRLADDPAIRTVNAQLAPGPAAGEATMAVSVDPQRDFDLYGSIANSRSPSVGGDRAAVGGSIRNLAFAGDLLAGEYGVTSGLSDGNLAYAAPLFRPGLSVDVRGAYDDAAVVDETLRPLDITARDWSVTGGVSDRVIDNPLTPRADGLGWIAAQSLSLGLHFDHRDEHTSLLGRPFSFSPGSDHGHTWLDALRGDVDWVMRGERQVLAVSSTVTVGLDGSASDIHGVPSPNPNFTTVLIQANYARRLGSEGLEFHARAAGQWASGLLYPEERFSIGGADTVRGYRENLILADEGILGSLEFSCPIGIGRGLCGGRSEDWRTVRVSVFTDGAFARNAISPQPDPTNLASVGFALNWSPANVLFARFTYGYALTKAPITGPSDIQDEGISFEVTLHPLPLLQRWIR